MMRTPLIAGNWKMFKTTAEAVALAERLKEALDGVEGVEVVICPPVTALAAVAKVLAGSPIGLGAQNMHWEKEGAYTGEVSPVMLTELGCRYVILGHSERRQYFGETDLQVRRKLKAALAHQLTPILCIGETLVEREDGRTFQVVEGQLQGGIAGISAEGGEKIVIAYEPVWAIGTGRTATPEQAGEVHAFIRKRLVELWGETVAAKVRILYVGGASLKAETFARIVHFQHVQRPTSNVPS